MIAKLFDIRNSSPAVFFYLFKKINFKVVLNIIHFILTALKLTFISVGYIDLRNVFKPSIKLIS